ncbi:hypothetical protein U1Q18_003548, partial [Sarracenia purpurea var. burkii]
TSGEEGARRLGWRLYPPLQPATLRGRDSFSVEDKGWGSWVRFAAQGRQVGAGRKNVGVAPAVAGGDTVEREREAERGAMANNSLGAPVQSDFWPRLA